MADGSTQARTGGFWRTVKKALRFIPFMDEVVAAWFAARDRQTPWKAKAIMLGAVAYFVLPIDLIPDFLLGFGFTDDIGVLAAAIGAIRGHVTLAHREAARQALATL